MSAAPVGPILIYGAGAVGQFVGGTLASAGHAVTLLGRPALCAALADTPLRLVSERPPAGEPAERAVCRSPPCRRSTHCPPRPAWSS